jgi:hypothetical protein
LTPSARVTTEKTKEGRPMRMRGTRCLVIVASLVAGCYPPPESAAPSVYVGALGDDGDASLALAVQGGVVAVYACGADPTRERYPRWVTTGMPTDAAQVDVARDGWRFDGAWSAAAASGTLVGPDGSTLAWQGTAARPGSLDGLYTALDSGCTSGVIVTNGDTAPVVRGAWCDAGGDVRQITPLWPLSFEGGGLAVEVAIDGAPRRLNVAPVRLPMP